MKNLLTKLSFLSLFSSALPAHAGLSLILDGGYLNSRIEYASTSTFSILSESGTVARGELSVGGDSFDLILEGGMNQFTFEAPSTRTLSEKSVTNNQYGAGFRYKNPYLMTTLTYEQQEALYLSDLGSNVFEIKKEAVGFAVLGLKLFGWGKGYRITIDGEIGIPVASGSTPMGDLKYKYFTRGTARTEFGDNWRIGLFVGVENHDYGIAQKQYYRTDFFAGLTIALGAGRSGGSRGGGGSSGSSNYKGGGPRFPFY